MRAVHASRRAGYPIRAPGDQRVCAPPPGFSQLAAPFLAPAPLGVRPGPLSRLAILFLPARGIIWLPPRAFPSFTLRFLPCACQISKKINVVINNQRKERRKGRVPKGNRACSTPAHSCLSLRKEVIQPHLPVRLPCYDFTPLAGLAFGSGPPCGLACRLRAHPTRMV